MDGAQSVVAALCITEATGNRPKDIATTLRRGACACAYACVFMYVCVSNGSLCKMILWLWVIRLLRTSNVAEGSVPLPRCPLTRASSSAHATCPELYAYWTENWCR